MDEQILEVLKNALAEIQPILSKEYVFSKELVLNGNNGILDSMALVSFIVTVEELVEESFNKNILLADDKAFSRKNSPFYSVSTLCAFIKELLEEQ